MTTRVFLCCILFLLRYYFLLVTVFINTLYCDGVWCFFLWRLYLLNCAIIIITVFVVTATVLVILIKFLIDVILRCLVGWCKNGVGISTFVTHSWCMYNTTFGGSGISNSIGV